MMKLMMKRSFMVVSLVAALILSQAASADNRGNRRGFDNHGYDNHRYGNHYRSSNRYSARNYYPGRYYPTRYNPYHYSNRRSSGINIWYGDRYSRHSDAGVFVGGMVLGSLLSYPRYSPPPVERVIYRSEPVVQTREVVVVNKTSSARQPVASGRRLLRDLEGNCFERVIDDEGNEIRVQLDAEECSF